MRDLASSDLQRNARGVDGSHVSRRHWLVSWLPAGALAGLQLPAHAGGQLEEPLVDSVRTALSASVNSTAPPVPVFADTAARIAYLRWLAAMSTQLRRRKTDLETRKEFLQTVWYESKRAGLDTTLVMGLIQVESGFRKFAVSSAGARGYMQVMPFWTRVLASGDPSVLFHMQTNLRFGCVILRHYLDRENGNLFMALGRYNGSRGKDAYPRAVMGASRQWQHRDA
ncbi:MAG: lytic transglycosylase domain-containing protein [Rhodoferax sp.]|jgi:soluble lytic murein transglycosylase-like protein|nr:lytic transglycosylase domain-containing protein [Rhodoferax sp.]